MTTATSPAPSLATFALAIATRLGLRATAPASERAEALLKRLVELDRDLVEIASERKAAERAAAEAAAAGTVVDGTKFAALDARAAAIRAAIDGIGGLLAETMAEASEVLRAELAAETTAAAEQTAAMYAKIHAGLAVLSRALWELGAIAPNTLRPDTLEHMMSGGMEPHRSPAHPALDRLIAAGGSLADLPPSVASVFPFGNTPMPIREAEKALEKFIPGITSIAADTTAKRQVAKDAEAKATTDHAARKVAWGSALIAAAETWPASTTPLAVATDPIAFSTANNLLYELRRFGIPSGAIHKLMAKATTLNNQTGSRLTWSADRFLVAKAIGWTGPIP